MQHRQRGTRRDRPGLDRLSDHRQGHDQQDLDQQGQDQQGQDQQGQDQQGQDQQGQDGRGHDGAAQDAQGAARLSPDRALDALLAGAAVPDDHAGLQPVADVLAALRRPAEGGEWDGLASALAAFHAQPHRPARAFRPRRRGVAMITALLYPRPALAIVASAVVAAGLAIGAYEGDLPAPVQRLVHDTLGVPSPAPSHSRGPHSASPSPAAQGGPAAGRRLQGGHHHHHHAGGQASQSSAGQPSGGRRTPHHHPQPQPSPSASPSSSPASQPSSPASPGAGQSSVAPTSSAQAPAPAPSSSASPTPSAQQASTSGYLYQRPAASAANTPP